MASNYIKTDIEQGLQYLRVGIMNALSEIESGVSEEIVLGGPIPLTLIVDCAEEGDWAEDPNMDLDWTNGWEVDYFYYMLPPSNQRVGIYGSLLNNICVRIKLDNE